ncbi:hypothetical protein ACJZ2D_016196 [Fusarium nematophilum]
MEQTSDEEIYDPYDSPPEVKAATRRAIRQLPRLPKPRPRDLTPSGFRQGSYREASFQESAYFKIPIDVRRQILRLAFGDRRLHMDLSNSHPDAPLASDKSIDDHHCGIDSIQSKKVANKRERLVDKTRPKSWQWWSSVCHRLPPDHDATLTGPMTNGGPDGPWADHCRLGEAAHCHSWPGHVPSKCHIGIMGWLLSCRQNYAEAIDVLYSTNTIAMTGEAMLVHLSQLLLPQRLAAITSLEISWPLKTRYVGDSWLVADEAHLNVILQLLSAEFPGLRRLYVSLEESDRLRFFHKEEYFPAIQHYLDDFVGRMPLLDECTFALPDIIFDCIFSSVAYAVEENGQWLSDGYYQVWRGLDGKMDAIRLPFVDSYPGPPCHLVQSGTRQAGYWILNGSNKPKDLDDFL